MTCFAETYEVTENEPEQRMRRNLQDVVDVDSRCYSLGAKAMLTQVAVSL